MSHEKPWLREYAVHGIPRSLAPYPTKPSHSFLQEAARQHPKMGYVQLGYEMPYGEALEAAQRLAIALGTLGISKGDRVATLLPTSIQFVLADHAISMAGAVHVPFSYLEPAEQLGHKLAQSTPKAVFLVEEHLAVVEAIVSRFGPVPMILTKIEDYSSAPPKPSAQAGIHWLIDLIAAHAAEKPSLSCNPDNDLEVLLFTGGTTGLPKGCMLSHSNIVVNAMQNSYAFGIVTHALAGNISVVIGLPFFHSYGHVIMHTLTHLGFKQLLVPDARDTQTMVGMIKEHHPLLQIGVPTQFIKMLDEELKGIGILGLSGSAPLPAEIEERFESKGAGVLMEGYGLSEMSPVTHINTSVLLRLFGRHMVYLLSLLLQIPAMVRLARGAISLLGYRTVGKISSRLIPLLAWISRRLAFRRREEKRATIGIPLPDTEVRFLTTDGDRELSLAEMIEGGEAGEMLLRGPQRMLGYWPDPGTGFDADGFIRTGDVVKVDAAGYFVIEDRIKDMIVVSGFKVYSRELDDILYHHPAVAMAATFGIPDSTRPGSEVVNAVVQLNPGFVGKVTPEDLITHLRGKVAKYAVPKHIELVDEMPLTEVYKVDKKLLREIRQKAVCADTTESSRATHPSV